MIMKKTALIAALMISLSACSVVEPRHRGNVYGSNSVGVLQATRYATIIDIQDAYIQSENGNLIVAGLGAIAGAYIGKHIGGGTGQEIARGMGALIGGYGSNEVYRKHASTGKVKQITFAIGANHYTVLQADPENRLYVGQTVKVVHDNNNKMKLLP